MKTLYLHAGTHKTGTISLQKWLHEHRAMLLDLGALVPQTGRLSPDTSGHHNLAWELTGDPRFSESYGTRHDLFDELASICHESVILSSEYFGCVSNKPDVLKSFLDEFRKNDYQVKLIVYLRDPFDYAASLYAGYKKHLAARETLETQASLDDLRSKTDPGTFVAEIAESKRFAVGNPLPCFSDFDYERLIARYEHATGSRESVLVRAYSHDVVSDFAALIGLITVPGAGAVRENQSHLSAEDLLPLKESLKRRWPQAAGNAQKLIAQRCVTLGDPLAGIRDLLVPSVGFIPDRMTDVSSWHGHLAFVPVVMQAVRPTMFVELGVHKGDSYSAFCQAVQSLGLNTKCYGVDTWQGDHQAGFYDSEIYSELKNYHDPRYSSFSTLLRKTFDEALNDFQEGSIDLLHIDGLHTYESVRHDFESWLPKLSEKAIVLFHDTVVRQGDFGVWKLWAELESRYPAFQFFHSHGLGVLNIGKNPTAASKSFFRLESRSRVALRQFIHHQAEAALARDEAERAKAEAALARDEAERAKAEAALARDEAERAKAEAALARDEAERAKAEAALARDEAERMRTHMMSVFESRSWRVTKPMREAMAVLRQVKAKAQTPDPDNRSLVYRAARKVYRTIPLPAGIKPRLRQAVKRGLGAMPPESTKYPEWMRRYDTLDASDREAIRAQIARWETPPLISVIMPVFNPPVEFLRKAIESVRRQLYPTWELCIADDASTDPDVGDLLRRYAAQDDRIKVVFREKNGHISAASNSALSLATGEFVALLDQDDVLAEHALYWVAHEIVSNPDVQLIYSDEDKIGPDGKRCDPYFKPDWNPELLLGQNAITHLGVYRRARVTEIGGFGEGMEGAQDWDLVLRFTQGLAGDQIRHIPAVLYHWRVHARSTASSSEAKPYAIRAGEKAVSEHLQRLGRQASLELVCGGVHFLPHFAVQGAPMVSIIIPTRDQVDVLRACLESLQKTRYPHYDIIVVDNQSSEAETLAYLDALRHEGRVRVLRYDRPFNYAALHNWAVPQIQGEFVCLLNNDVEIITPEWLGEMLALAQQEGVGAVGAKLLYPDDTVQHAGVVTGIGGVAGHLHRHYPKDACGSFGRAALVQNFSAVTAACLVVRKAHWFGVNGMTETLSIALNDVDFCLKLREKGLRNVWTPAAQLYHHESKSRGSDHDPEKLERFALERAYMQWRWGHALTDDPAYNPNLSLTDESCSSFASPPRRLRPWKDDLRVIDAPYGVHLMPVELMHIAPDSAISGSLPWPVNLAGRLRGLAFLVGTHQGKSQGQMKVAVTDGNGQTAHGQVQVDEATDDNGFVRVLFSGEGLSIDTCERLHYSVEWRRAEHVISLYGFRLNERWEHRIEGHPGWVGRIQLLMAP